MLLVSTAAQATLLDVETAASLTRQPSSSSRRGWRRGKHGGEEYAGLTQYLQTQKGFGFGLPDIKELNHDTHSFL